MSPAGINIYIRSMNSFSSWLKEEEHVAERIVLKQLKAPLKPVTVFSNDDVRAILAFRPGGFYEFRTWTLLQLLLDTGVRIEESLQLTNVDFESLTFTVTGKGNKTRRVPFSMELRKTLFRYQQLKQKKSVSAGFFFCGREGQKLRYRNVYRDIIALCQAVGITKRVHPHLTRHSFACHFMKNGGNIYSLSRILGHASINTTQVYIRGLGVEDFREEHARLSPLAKRA